MIYDLIAEEVRARGRSLTARYRDDANEILRVLREEARRHPRGIVDTVRVVAADPTASACERGAALHGRYDPNRGQPLA